MMGDWGWAWIMLPALVVMVFSLLAVVVPVAVALHRLDGHISPGPATLQPRGHAAD
jgi:hypothetical protein